MLVMAVFGGHWVTVFDPLVLLYRTTTTALLPGITMGRRRRLDRRSSRAIRAWERVRTGWHLTAVTEPVYDFLRDHVFAVPKQAFLGGGAILAIFLVTLLLNWYRPRFWCRYLCPLGRPAGAVVVAAAAAAGRRAGHLQPVRPVRHVLRHGAAAARARPKLESGGVLRLLQLRRLLHAAKPRASAGPGRGARSRPSSRIDLSKRAMFGAAVGGLLTLGLMRITPQARGTTFHPFLLRPPGARPEREFLQRCTACGLCMKVCPTGGLQPTWSEAGLEGLWTPRLVPKIGYCDYACNLCSQVCPTEAIVPLSVDEKQEVRIGLAAFDTTRCIPYAYGRDCMVCEEHCPIPTKAIYFTEVEVPDRKSGKQHGQAAARRSRTLHRLRHLRERLSLQGPAGGAGVQHEREPQSGESADPARRRPIAVLSG